MLNYKPMLLIFCLFLIHQSDAGWEEYYDYIFPEDAANQPNLKLLAMAKMWKKQQVIDDIDISPEKSPTVEEGPTSEESADPSEKQPEKESDRNTVTEAEQENTYNDRDDSSSSSSESDNDATAAADDDDDDGKKKQEKRSSEEDKD